jgi:diguanylate cyclase (GGDEF)-like protein
VQKQPSVLVADPDDALRAATRTSLEAAGLEVHEANTGRAALAALRGRSHDALILAQNLPDTPGLELCAHLRSQPESEHLPILMIIDDDLDSIPGCYSAGATDFVRRPVNWLVLVQRVRFILRSSAAFADLRESQSDLAEAQRMAKLGHWTYDFSSSELSFSPECYRIFGISEGTPLDFAALLGQIHPDDRERVGREMAVSHEERRSCRIDHRITAEGEAERVVHMQGELRCDAFGKASGMRGSIQDVTERVRAEERIRYLAYHDSLTGLGNRLLFRDRLTRAIERARRGHGVTGIIFIDIDRFKRINDTLGHSAGDELLCAVSERLSRAVRHTDTVVRGTDSGGPSDSVSRLGGDEFTVLLDELKEPYDISRVARRIQEYMPEPFEIEGQEVFVTASMGIACWPMDGEDLSTLMRNADLALYEAKNQGRDNYKFYSKSMNVSSFGRLQLETRLRQALERGDLFLHYQPQVAVDDGRVTGVEALLRWNDSELGSVSPAEFIPIAEQIGFIGPIGEWVLETACAQAAIWQRSELPELTMAVNLSAQQLSPRLPAIVDEALSKSGLDPSRLELEITESALMQHEEVAAHVLRELKGLGVRLALDDFGTGFSSLSFLKRFPVDTVKIDQSFVRDLEHSSDDRAITEAIISMAGALGLRVVAEGVETLEQLDFLREHRCNHLQGWLFSAALPAEELPSFIQRLAEKISG